MALNKIYYTPKEAGSFGEVQGLKYALWSKGTQVKNKNVVKWLSSQDTYTLHKPLWHTFSWAQVVTFGINGQWQCDLADVSNLATQNKGIKYLLTCIDIFSKYAWVEPLKSKTGKALVEAFDHILQSDQKPLILQTD